MNLQKIKNGKVVIVHLAIAAAIVIGIFSTIYIIRSFSRVTTDDAYITGRTHTIAARIMGTVSDVNINDNQNVKAGDVLVKIDPADYELKLRQAQAEVDAENARLLDAEAGIKAMEANLELQQASLNQATLDKNRAEALYQKSAMPKEQYEKVITAYNIAAAQANPLVRNAKQLGGL